MEITIDQIKAARALLDWTQDDLATNSGLSKASIQNYENKKTEPNSTSLYKIIDAFADNGVEFIEEGVQKRTLKTKTFRGQKGLIEFMDLVYETARDAGGEFCVSNVDESIFTARFGDAEDAIYTRKMSVLEKKFTFKTLIKEGDTNFVGSQYSEYRWVPVEQFHSIPFYVFGDYMAFLIFGKQTIVHLIESKEIADAQRAQFYLIWESAKVPNAK